MLAVGFAIVASLVLVALVIRFSRMRSHLGEILIPCALIGWCVIFLAETFRFRYEEAGPALMPRLWIILIIFLSCLILLQIFTGKAKPSQEVRRKGLLGLSFAALIGYFLAMPHLGYFLSTFLFIVLLLHMLSYPKIFRIYLIAGGWCLFSYLIFYKVLYIQLPLGIFEFFLR